MGAYLRLVNHERDFVQGASTRSVIVNDLDDTSAEQRKHINRTLYTVSGDVFSNIPSCECGSITGTHNQGVVCDICNFPVSKKIERNLEPLVWLRAPNNCAPFINPRIWFMLNDYFTKSGFEVIQYITDANYKFQGTNKEWETIIINDLNENNITGRGWNYFHENFDQIMSVLFSLPSARKSSATYKDYLPLKQLLENERHNLFTQYLAVPNRALLIIEENESGRQRDSNIDAVINAMRLLTGIDVGIQKYSQRTKETRLVKVLNYLSQYYEDFDKASAKKEGIWRRLIMGGRTHFASRAVISSITEPHVYDELHIPWGIGVQIFRYHLLNKLFKRGFTLIKAVNFLNTYALKYHPLLDTLFKELIEESPYKGIPVIHTRNPVLGSGSTQLCRFTKVKTDTSDYTISTSILIVLGWNLDFKLN